MSKNLSFNDYLENDAGENARGSVINVVKERLTFLATAPVLEVVADQMYKDMLYLIRVQTVEALTSTLFTNTAVGEFGKLLEATWANRDVIEGAHRLNQWVGSHAPAAYAASPLPFSGVNPEKEIPGSGGLHLAPPNTPIREALRPLPDGSIRSLPNYGVAGMYQGTEVTVCGLVDPLKQNLCHDPVRSQPAQFLGGMGVFVYLEEALVADAQSRGMKIWNGESVGDVTICPSGKVYYSPGSTSPMYVNGCLFARRQFLGVVGSMCCDLPVYDTKSPFDAFHRFALSFSRFTLPYVLSISTNAPYPQKDRQFLNRCYRPLLQEFAMKSETAMQSVLAILSFVGKHPSSRINGDLKALGIRVKPEGDEDTVFILPSASQPQLCMKKKEVPEAHVPQRQESQLLTDLRPMVEMKEKEERNDGLREKEKDEENSEDEDLFYGSGSENEDEDDSDPPPSDALFLKSKLVGLKLPFSLTPAQGERTYLGVKAATPTFEPYVGKGQVPPGGGTVFMWKVLSLDAYGDNNAAIPDFLGIPRTSHPLYLPPGTLPVGSTVDVISRCNKAWCKAGVTFGGSLAKSQADARKALGTLDIVPIFPFEGCILYGPVRVLPLSTREPATSLASHERALMVLNGIFFTVKNKVTFACFVIGMDANCLVHARIIACGHKDLVMHYVLRVMRLVKNDAALTYVFSGDAAPNDIGVIGRVVCTIQSQVKK